MSHLGLAGHRPARGVPCACAGGQTRVPGCGPPRTPRPRAPGAPAQDGFGRRCGHPGFEKERRHVEGRAPRSSGDRRHAGPPGRPGSPRPSGVGIAPGSPSAHVSASIPQTATTHCHEEPGRPGVRRRSDASFRGPRRRRRAARGGRAVDCTGDGTHGASRSPRAALCPAAGRLATDAAVGGSARGGSADGPTRCGS